MRKIKQPIVYTLMLVRRNKHDELTKIRRISISAFQLDSVFESFSFAYLRYKA